MCEILVRAVNGTCQKAEANPLRGMPVVVKPDGHVWGKQERPPEYVVIKLPGVSSAIVQQYLVVWMTRTPNSGAPDTMTTLGRRRYLVPNSILSLAENNGGSYTITRTQFSNSIIDRAA